MTSKLVAFVATGSIGLMSAALPAATIDLYSLTKDFEARANNTYVETEASIMVGETTAAPTRRNAIFIFDLNGVGNSITSASLRVTVTGVNDAADANPLPNGDLHLLGFSNTDTAFRASSTFSDSDTAGLYDKLLNASSTANGDRTTGSMAALVTAINARGANDRYLYLRLNHDYNPAGSANVNANWLVASGDAANNATKPLLTLVPEPATAGIALLGAAAGMLRRRRA